MTYQRKTDKNVVLEGKSILYNSQNNIISPKDKLWL